LEQLIEWMKKQGWTPPAPAHQLMPVEPTVELGWAYLDAANADDPGHQHRFNWAGYRAMVAAAKGLKT